MAAIAGIIIEDGSQSAKDRSGGGDKAVPKSDIPSQMLVQPYPVEIRSRQFKRLAGGTKNRCGPTGQGRGLASIGSARPGFNQERRLEAGCIFETQVSRDMLDKRIGYQQLIVLNADSGGRHIHRLHKLHVPWFDDRHSVIQNHRGLTSGLDLNSNGMHPGAEPAVIEQQTEGCGQRGVRKLGLNIAAFSATRNRFLEFAVNAQPDTDRRASIAIRPARDGMNTGHVFPVGWVFQGRGNSGPGRGMPEEGGDTQGGPT